MAGEKRRISRRRRRKVQGRGEGRVLDVHIHVCAHQGISLIPEIITAAAICYKNT